MRVGVLAAQGAFAEHIAVLGCLGAEARPVRLPAELRGISGLIIPGGESTTISRLMYEDKLAGEIRELAVRGLPVWGTCAGLIMLAGGGNHAHPQPLGLLDIKVHRNAYGRQCESFETGVSVPALGEAPFPAVFIRAPAIEEVGPQVEVLARLADGGVVAVRQGRLLATTFHPELTGDFRFHQYFLDIIAGER